MRKGMWAWGLLAGLGLASPAAAQQVSSFVGSFNPQPIVNVPIDMSNIVAPIPSYKPPFSLSSLIPNIKLPNFPLLFGSSSLPSPSSFPSTHYPNSFQPLPPILPNQ
jgi:hypothetical protein